MDAASVAQVSACRVTYERLTTTLTKELFALDAESMLHWQTAKTLGLTVYFHGGAAFSSS
jgi:hypothetical protein